jgi:hypothetical protein
MEMETETGGKHQTPVVGPTIHGVVNTLIVW